MNPLLRAMAFLGLSCIYNHALHCRVFYCTPGFPMLSGSLYFSTDRYAYISFPVMISLAAGAARMEIREQTWLFQNQ